jgi:hypothetical protein
VKKEMEKKGFNFNLKKGGFKMRKLLGVFLVLAFASSAFAVPPACIFGEVTDKETGKGISGAMIEVRYRRELIGRGMSDEEGWYKVCLGIKEMIKVRVLARAKGYKSAAEYTAIAPGERAMVNLALAPDSPPPPPPPPPEKKGMVMIYVNAVKVEVVAKLTGPAEYVEKFYCRTLIEVVPGCYRVVLSAEGYKPAVRKVCVQAGEMAKLLVVMEPTESDGVVIQDGGKVEDESGAEVEVPKGAVDRPASVAIEKVDPAVASEVQAVACYKLETDASFRKAVKVSFPVSSDVANPCIFKAEEITGPWVSIGGVVANGKISVQVDSFSYFAIGEAGLSLEEATWGSVKEMFK